MDISFVTLFKLFYLTCLSPLIAVAQDYGLCADPICSVPIGKGVAISPFDKIDDNHLSFKVGESFDIFVRDYGARKHLFGVLMNGKKGYVPKLFIREEKTYIRELVPATIEFRSTNFVDANSVSSQVDLSSQWSHQSDQFSSSEIVPNPQTGVQDYQSVPPTSNEYSENVGPVESLLSSGFSQFHASSSGAHPNFDYYTENSQQFLGSESTNYPSEFKASEFNNIQGQFSGSESSNGEQFTRSDTTNVLVENTRSESSSQNHFPSDTQVLPSHHINVGQVKTFQVDTTQQLYNQPDIAYHQSQSEFSSLQSSFSPQLQSNSPELLNSHNFVGSKALYPNNALENNPTFGQSDVVFPNPVSENKHSSNSVNSEQHIESSVTESALQPSSRPDAQNVQHTSYDETKALLEKIGYDANELLKNDYTSETAYHSNPSQDLYFNLDKVNPSDKQHLAGDNYGFANQISSQSGYNGLPHAPSIDDPSFQSSSTELKVDNTNSVRVAEEVSSSVAEEVPSSVESNKSPVFDEMPSDSETTDNDDDEDENNEDEDSEDETNVEDEHEVSNAEKPLQEENQYSNINLDGIDVHNEDTSVSKPYEIPSNEVISSQNVNSELQTKVQRTDTQEPSVQPTAPIIGDSSTVSPSVELSSQNELESRPSVQFLHKTGSLDPSLNNFVKQTNEESIVADKSELGSESSSANEFKMEMNLTGGNDTLHVVANDSSLVKEGTTFKEENDSSFGVNETNVVANGNSLVKEEENGIPSDTSGYATKKEEYAKPGVFSFDSSEEVFGRENVNETDLLLDKEQKMDLDNVRNITELSEAEKVGYINPYQIRNLKGEQESKESQHADSSNETEENVAALDFYASLEESLKYIRTFIAGLLSWIPEPLHSVIMDLEKGGISSRVIVFTAICAIPCILLIIAVVYIKEKSKERKLIAQIALIEKNVYNLSAEKIVFEEKLEKTEAEFESSKSMLNEERKTFDEMKLEVGTLKQYIKKTDLELENNVEEINSLREQGREYMELVSDHEKAYLALTTEKDLLEKRLVDQEDTMSSLTGQLLEKEKEIKVVQEEKSEYLQCSENYEEKLSQLQQNCNQLLKEAEVWNVRVNELNSKLSKESSAKEELENSLKVKEEEIESLTHLVQTFKSFEELDDVDVDEDEIQPNDEKLQCLMNASSILVKLKRQEEENISLSEKLLGEKNQILNMEVELLEAKSENDKLKISYNQALQDKTEAQTKLDVLTTYFKDKEIQMQRQLGAQEAFRERREKDADSAERQIVLIEQENSSYKYQVASMKQEMEETERNLKSQIAAQEKKAHENWIAARAAERKLEDMKQEVTQLRQRLTLLEREQENWVNSSRDDVIRPIPKRISGVNDDSANSQDINNSIDSRHNMFAPPPLPLPMMLPPDRPLPPLPPPPFLPPLDAPFRPQPWHLPPDSMSGSDFRITPPDFARGRESTPPRGRHSAVIDGDMGPRQSSPLGGEMRDSRNSTPPHSLPDFHDIPPPPRPFFPPPGHHMRYPMPPPFRREFAQREKRTDNQDNSSSRGVPPSSVPQDNWPHSNSRV